MVEYWTNFCCFKGVTLFNAIVHGELIEAVLQNLVYRNYRHIPLSLVLSIFRHLESVWQRDRYRKQTLP